MVDHDGLNFECSTCGSHTYSPDPVIESYILSRGGKRCYVCGHVLVFHGDYYSCLQCNLDMARLINPHERWETWARGSRNPKTIVVPALLAFTLFSIYSSVSLLLVML